MNTAPADATGAAGALEIRSLREADLDAVLAIENASFTTPWRRVTFEGLLRRTDTDLLAATLPDGRLVGYAALWTVVDQSELGNVAVAPDGRGRGVGRRLVQEGMRRVAARGSRECFLEVRESNQGAQALYRSLGYQTVGRRRRYYRDPVEDALVMRVDLP